MLVLALRSESCISLIAIGEAQKIMNRNSLQSCTLSSGEIGEYISTVMVLLACSKEYLTLLAPVTQLATVAKWFLDLHRCIRRNRRIYV